ncbi:DNA mismatch repair protein MutS [bacterium]|nr:DNA mismatch repair protein MutS [bacterium]
MSSTGTDDSLNTPMLRQYSEIKAEFQDAILFFRLGDFYEMFQEDAKIASRELELTLTGRGKDENRVPMCGIPHHASENYIQKLVSRGFKVAICEQVEDSAANKGLTRREVVKIVTPGTVMSASALGKNETNFLVGVSAIKGGFSLSFLELSTGEFKVCRVKNISELERHIQRLQPKEIVLPVKLNWTPPDDLVVNRTDFLSGDRAAQLLINHFGSASLASFGLDGDTDWLSSALAVLEYAKFVQKTSLPHVHKLMPYTFDDIMILDRTTMVNLELVQSRDSSTKQSSMFALLNETCTAMGGRKLRSVIAEPLRNVKRIEARLDAVEELVLDFHTRGEIRDVLNEIYDIERLVGRIVSGTNNPRDCISLRDSLNALNRLPNLLTEFSSRFLRRQFNFYADVLASNSPVMTTVQLITDAIVEGPPTSARDGGIIKDGYSQVLDDLKQSFAEVRQWIASLEEMERGATGIRSLKVGFNKVFGYYIELPNSHKDKIPDHYVRKQTLANAERYITPELKEKELILLNGEERQFALEYELFQEIVRSIFETVPFIQEVALMLSELDTIQSLATVSQKNGYVRPRFEARENRMLMIDSGRHPIVERGLETYTPNSVSMTKDHRFLLVTGPNMAGKSTMMRQVALAVVMAQMGCFVPANAMHLSPVDRLYTRIGALDNLYKGHSTFMVEMLETASILGTATPDSLVILDEVGRGTSTFDGMSIACSITKDIALRIGARTLFATHYHELTALEGRLPGLFNYTMEIVETDDDIVFTHRFLKGTADKSYGLHVAKMAGIPLPVIQEAQKMLAGFEQYGIEFLKAREGN